MKASLNVQLTLSRCECFVRLRLVVGMVDLVYGPGGAGPDVEPDVEGLGVGLDGLDLDGVEPEPVVDDAPVAHSAKKLLFLV